MYFLKKLSIISLLGLFVLVPFVRAEIFFRDNSAEGVDSLSFELLGDGYAQDNYNIYFGKYGALEDIDMETFKYLKDGFSKDKNNIYYSGLAIKGVSIESFQKMKGAYSKDLNNIFFENRKIEEAKLAGFVVLRKNYAKNLEQVFYKDQLITDVDVDSFVELADEYAKDENSVYYKGEVVGAAYMNSFKVLKNGYAMNAYTVFREGKVVNDVDLKTVEMFGDYLLKDESRVYTLGANFINMILDVESLTQLNDFYYEVNGRTFVYQYQMLLEATINLDKVEFLNKYYAKDGADIYYLTDKMEKVDVESFEVLSDNYTRDKNNIYFKSLKIKNAVPGEVELLGNDYLRIIDTDLYNNLQGKIILKVEDLGKAYYVHYNDNEIFYLGRPEDAFSVMREQGIGVSTNDLEKIPLGLVEVTGNDSDEDGLSDLFEDAIGTDKNKKDTDADGYDDLDELKIDYNPTGLGAVTIDKEFAKKQNGKIFLQVEKNGEAWYINPADGKRYFLGRPADAFNVMRDLGLGISNENFVKL